jgi:hypothetical protein
MSDRRRGRKTRKCLTWCVKREDGWNRSEEGRVKYWLPNLIYTFVVHILQKKQAMKNVIQYGISSSTYLRCRKSDFKDYAGNAR